MFPVMRAIGNAFKVAQESEEGLWRFARVAQLAGVTTATDMANAWTEEGASHLALVTSHEDFPVRIVTAYRSLDAPTEIERGLRGLGEL